MKRGLTILVAFLCVAGSSLRMIIWTLEASQDDEKVREAVLKGPATALLRNEFSQFQKRRLWPLERLCCR
jgi:hypothetical protein